MNDEEAVEPQNTDSIEQIMDQQDDTNVQEENVHVEKHEKTMIPLSVAQALREKKKELELELQWERQERQRLLQAQSSTKPPEEDNSRFESATKEDLSRSHDETVRVVEERIWIRNNPEKYERINEFLPTFLKQRPNLVSAINLASNRYEEAYELMDKLSPKQQQQLKKDATPIPKKEAPNAPGGVPKAAALNEAVDVMNMSDSEFSAWRSSKKRRR